MNWFNSWQTLESAADAEGVDSRNRYKHVPVRFSPAFPGLRDSANQHPQHPCDSYWVSDTLLFSAALFQNGDCRQGFAFYELQESTAAGGNVRNLVSYVVFVNGCHGVAAAGQ